jgi:16S rRNA (guanine(966)-N(2))-methyltransferase RsmD
MRVISGSAKGRRLRSVPGEGTRPITERVKAALFNILGADIEGASLLDLFAGTGSVGIEALSRGAAHVLFIDTAYKAVETLRRNLEALGFGDSAELLKTDAFRYLRNADPATRFDYIYVAPPQHHELWSKALLALDDKPLLASDGEIIVQIFPKEYRELPLKTLRHVRERRYGSTVLHFYMLASAEKPGEPGVSGEPVSAPASSPEEP